MKPRPCLRYPGAKWRMAPLIASILVQLPHVIYLEPFFGSGAVFFCKRPSPVELINDIDGEVINLFRVLRETPDELVRLVALTPYSENEWKASLDINEELPATERARRLLLRAWQSHAQRLGSRTGWAHDGVAGAKRLQAWLQLPDRLLECVERLKWAQLFNRDALAMTQDYNAPEVCIYADPPYLGDTRGCEGNLYRHEMKDPQEHALLLGILLAHPGPVVLSGYAHPLYDTALKDWTRLDVAAIGEKGAKRTEVLWVNRPLDGAPQGSLFGGAK